MYYLFFLTNVALHHVIQKSKTENDQDIPTFEKEQIEQAKRIMKPFVLRRLKKDVLQDLPKKTDIKLEVVLAPTQEEQYKGLVRSFQEVDANVNFVLHMLNAFNNFLFV